MAGWVLALALLQAGASPPPAPPPYVHSAPLAGSLPPLDPPDEDPHRHGGVRQRGPLFISPMGEPFRGHDAQYQWFDQADTNHDGALTIAEFEADAARWFAVLDREHDGEIDPGDIDYYEKFLPPEIRVGGVGGGFAGRGARGGGGEGGGRNSGRGGRSAGGGGRGGGTGRGGHGGTQGNEGNSTAPAQASYGRQGAARYGWFDYPEPITVADTNFNRGVDPVEFRKAADDRFAVLDKNHDGVVKRAELPALPRAMGEDHQGGRPRGGGPGRPAGGGED
ncbi:MAG: EF-hand domain-containing protein [Sphingomonas sp.]